MSAKELEALAAKGREQKRREAEKREREAQARTRERELEKDAILRRSLGRGGFVDAAFILAGMVVAGGVIALLDTTFPDLEWKELWFTLIMVPPFFMAHLTEKIHRKAELRRIRSIPYAFDVDGYLDGLRKRYNHSVNVEVRVSFLRPVDAAAKRTIADALLAAVGECHASWQADELIIKSIAFETTKWVKKGDDNEIVAYNGKLHRWFRRCVDQGLSKVHPAYGITSLRVTYV
jgi:hypothetical protein